MPLTDEGREVMSSMKHQYGKKKGKSVFYASINKGKPGSEDWEAKKHAAHQKKAMETLK